MGSFGLEDRVCIVTGATGGLGRVVVRLLLEEGAAVLGAGLSPTKAERLGNEFKSYGDKVQVVSQDMRVEEAGERLVQAALSRWDRLDVVVNNAAPFKYRAVEATPIRADWVEIFTAKLLGYWSLMTAAIPELTKTRGAITNVSGGAGMVASPGSPHIGAMNAAIISMSESYALKLARSGVRVNVVTPSVIDNDRFATRVELRAKETGVSPEVARAELSARVPVGFPTSPEEIARVILMLSSPFSRSLTGAQIVVGGASHLQGHARTG